MAHSNSNSNTNGLGLDELLAQAESTLAATWSILASHGHDWAQQLEQSTAQLLDRISNHGTLPLPSLKDLTTPAQPPTPPPPPPPASNALITAVHKHPWLSAALVSTALGGTAYYLYPAHTLRLVTPLVAPLRPYTPLFLLPTSNRPLRITTEGGEIRKEAVLILGAHGILAELALDFEQKGFIVICTVQHPSEVDALERRSRGWIKVLVLDPTESSSVTPFLRSLSTSLSLRFPLHTSGDPFSRPSHTLALTAVINGLSLSPTSLYPVEGLEGGDVRKEVGERIATLVKVVQGVLPIMRSASSRPGAAEGVFLSLFPSSSSLSAPFASLPSTSTAAQIALIHSLRRELRATPNNNMRVKILQVGNFSSAALVEGSVQQEKKKEKDLPLRLSNLYAPALARRKVTLPSSTVIAEAPKQARRSTHPKKLHQKVFNIIIYGRGGVQSSVGAGALSHRFLPSFLPFKFQDLFYTLQDGLTSLYLSHLSRFITPQTITSPPSTRGPLPTPPAGQHPENLRPGFNSTTAASQIPVDHFSSSTKTSAGGGGANSNHNRSGYASSRSSEEGDTSSIEEFGSLSGSFTVGGGGAGGEGGMGSFVNVERE